MTLLYAPLHFITLYKGVLYNSALVRFLTLYEGCHITL